MEHPGFNTIKPFINNVVSLPRTTIKLECPTCDSLVQPKKLYWRLRGEEDLLTSQLITTREMLDKVKKQDALLRMKLQEQATKMESELKLIKTLVDVAGLDNPYHYRNHK